MEIWKFTLDGPIMGDGSFVLSMPEDAECLSVATQFGIPQLWAKVEPHAAKTARKFYIVGTGKPFPEGATDFIGTFEIEGGRLIWHLFEGEL